MKKIASFPPILLHFAKRHKIISALAVIVVCGLLFSVQSARGQKNSKPQYQTQAAEKGTLMVTVSASGQVTQANSATVDTQASGVISKVYVDNGTIVKTGDKIAEIDLDLVGKQRASAAWASYQSARNNLETAKNKYFALQSDLMTNWKTYMDTAQSSLYENSDKTPNTTNRQLPQYISTYDQWLSAEAAYKQQENVVAQAQTALNTSWLSYQQTSSTIYAPISGTVTGLSLQIGSVLTAQSNTSGTAASQKIASIQTGASPVVQVNLSQVDTPKVKIGDKATLVFDAFSDKTFTGKVISIDTIGSVSSGVTTYPAVIKLDMEVPEIFSNMTASANIITMVKDDVLLVPSGAVQTRNGTSIVRVFKNGEVQDVNVETGISSGTQTEILSGISEGELVVTGSNSSGNSTSATNGQQRSGQSQSPFGGFGGGAVFRR